MLTWQGVRAFFATNSSARGTPEGAAHGEAWGFYPDAQPLRSFYAGDARAAIVPFLAYQCAHFCAPAAASLQRRSLTALALTAVSLAEPRRPGGNVGTVEVSQEACKNVTKYADRCSADQPHLLRGLIRHYGDSFKWLFYGDDDSVLFLRGAMNAVAGLDPDMPYALTGGLFFCLLLAVLLHVLLLRASCQVAAIACMRSSISACMLSGVERSVPGADNMWFSYPTSDQAYHPCAAAPACVPCGYPQERLTRLPFPMARGCPCTPEAICAADATGALNKPPKPCGMPRSPATSHLFLKPG
jgi:hypothetical protein